MFHAAVFTGIFTGIDINDGQCFRRIDHQITTAFQPDLSGGRQIDLSFQAAELVERKQIILIQTEFGKILQIVFFQIMFQRVINLRIVCDD